MSAPAFTAADVAAFAELIGPALAKVAPHAGSLEQAVHVAVDATRREESDVLARRLASVDALAAVLGGTYDEFRAEAGAE